MKTKLILVLLTLFLSESSLSMIIRHDVNPEMYLASEHDHPAVFPLQINDDRKECVATLIDQNWAITAAHCTVLINQASKDPHLVLINNKFYAVRSVHIHPEFGEVKGVHDENGQLIDMVMNPKNMSYDVALLQLAQPVEDVLPIKLYTGKDEVNLKILMLGWGDFANGKTGTLREESVNDGQFRKAYNLIDEIDDNYLVFRFDSPKSKRALDLEGINGPGDSGGPALITQGEKFVIIGVSSRGYYPTDADNSGPEGKYGWIENYVRVSTILDWINSAFEAPNSIKSNSDGLKKSQK